MSYPITIEVVQFKLQEHVSDYQFLQLSTKIQNWLQTVPGFLSREVSKGDSGEWVDLVHWRSKEEALTAANELMKQPCAAEFATFFDDSTIKLLHLEQKQMFNK